jgi:hypothetical protein
MRAKTLILAGVAVAIAGPSLAADLLGQVRPPEASCGWWPSSAPRRAGPACVRGPVPTNSPYDPTYVGSAYGLGRPNVFGARPPLGTDAY